MTIHVPYIMQPAVADPDITYTAQELRMYQQASATLAGQGVYKAGHFQVTQRGAGANFSVDVAAGTAGVLGDDITNQGLYLIWSDATVNVATPSAPGSGTRVHRLVLQVRDKLSNGAFTTYDAVPQILQDTGSGTPAEPNSAMTLALISISAGQLSVQNANITDERVVLSLARPSRSFQAGAGAWNAVNTWTDFSGANWPPVTFTVPPSGQVFVTISAAVFAAVNVQAAIGWRISGTDTVANSTARAVGAAAAISDAVLIRASRRTLVTGLTPGATDTVTPGWWQNGASSTDLNEGDLVVEAVA